MLPDEIKSSKNRDYDVSAKNGIECKFGKEGEAVRSHGNNFDEKKPVFVQGWIHGIPLPTANPRKKGKREPLIQHPPFAFLRGDAQKLHGAVKNAHPAENGRHEGVGGEPIDQLLRRTRHFHFRGSLIHEQSPHHPVCPESSVENVDDGISRKFDIFDEFFAVEIRVWSLGVFLGADGDAEIRIENAPEDEKTAQRRPENHGERGVDSADLHRECQDDQKSI